MPTDFPCSGSEQKSSDLNANTQDRLPNRRQMDFPHMSASSTVRSKQTLTSTPTHISQREFLELADCYYVNPEPAVVGQWQSPVTARDVLSETVRNCKASVPCVQSGKYILDPNLEYSHERIPYRTAQTDAYATEGTYSGESEGIICDVDLVPCSSLDGWLGYTRESQSLHTIKSSNHSNCSPFTQLEVADPSLTTSTSMASVTPPSSSVASFMTVSCFGRVYSVFKRRKSRQLKPEPKHRLQSMLPTATQSGLTRHVEAGAPCLSQRRELIITDDIISSNGIIRQTRLPSSPPLGLGLDSVIPGLDLDYDYILAVDVLVHGAPAYDISSGSPRNV
jgi:hypothetical protein